MSIGSLTLGPYGYSTIDEVVTSSSTSSINLDLNTTSITSPDIGGSSTSSSADLVCVAGDLAFDGDNRYLFFRFASSATGGTIAQGTYRTRSHYTTSTFSSSNNTFVDAATYFTIGNINSTTSKSGERLSFLCWIKYNAAHSLGRPWGDVTMWYQTCGNNPYLNLTHGVFQTFNTSASRFLRIYPNSGSWAACRVKAWHIGAS